MDTVDKLSLSLEFYLMNIIKGQTAGCLAVQVHKGLKERKVSEKCKSGF